MNIFVGLNYICAAPFSTESRIQNDTISMYIIDTCPEPVSCYAKCDCYYTFDFKFLSDNANYFYRVKLYDAMKKDTITIKEEFINK